MSGVTLFSPGYLDNLSSWEQKQAVETVLKENPSPNSPLILSKITPKTFLENLPFLDSSEVFDYLSYNYRSILHALDEQSLMEYLKLDLFAQGLESLFWHKSWALFNFMDTYPNIDLCGQHFYFRGCLEEALKNNPNRFRHYLNHPSVYNFILTNSDIKNLEIFEQCKGFWRNIPDSHSSPIISLFKEFERSFQSKESVLNCLETYIPLLSPKAQKLFLSVPPFFNGIYILFKKDANILERVFRSSLFENENEKKLFFFPFLPFEEQNAILAQILFQKGDFKDIPVKSPPRGERLESIDHHLIPYFILQRSLSTPVMTKLNPIQEKTLECVKKHLNDLIEKLYDNPKKIPIYDQTLEEELTARGMNKIGITRDLKSSLLSLPFGEFLFVIKHSPLSRGQFSGHGGFYELACNRAIQKS
jgi:hypothetical protein